MEVFDDAGTAADEKIAQMKREQAIQRLKDEIAKGSKGDSNYG